MPHPPFALSLSKGPPWFDKLTTNGSAHPPFALSHPTPFTLSLSKGPCHRSLAPTLRPTLPSPHGEGHCCTMESRR